VGFSLFFNKIAGWNSDAEMGGGGGEVGGFVSKNANSLQLQFVQMFTVDPGGSLVGYAGGFLGRGNILFLVLSQGDGEPGELFLVYGKCVEERCNEAAMGGAIAQSIRYNRTFKVDKLNIL
jgi:hypothetical protein